jgi:hypothetical protein
MIFCEDCRVNKAWARPAGYPYIGLSIDSKCDVCGRITNCYDIPASMLTPYSKKTFEEKTVAKIMQEGFKDKAESLVVMHLSGRIDHEKTELLRRVFVKNYGTVDWYATYQLRVTALRGYRQDEESKRNRGTGEL